MRHATQRGSAATGMARSFSPASLGFRLRRARGDTGAAAQLAMNAGDPFHLAFGRESFIKALIAKGPGLLAPGPQTIFPAVDAPILGIRVLPGQIGTNPQHGLPGRWEE